MSITKTQEIKNSIKCKGELQKVEIFLHILDERTGDVEVLTTSDMTSFIGKSITVSIAESNKKEVADDEGFEAQEEESEEN